MDRDALAQRGLRQAVAMLADELHGAIDDGLDADTLHSIVGLWEANNLNEELTFDALVEAGRPTECDNCSMDVAPYDDYGRPLENAWEWYMVVSKVWEEATGDGMAPQFLCIGCLETRLGRPLTRDDFSCAPLNEPGPLDSDRLLNRLSAK